MITIVMAVYGQPLMLAHQIKTITGYSESVLDQLTVIIVDDCGDPAVTAEELGSLIAACEVKLFRVGLNIPWNQMSARNLGMQHADGWCVLLDPDMVLSEDAIELLLGAASREKRGTVVKWALRHVGSGQVDITSPNTWMIHREDFFAVGGYVEHYAGSKGWSDVTIQDVFRSTYKIKQRTDITADFYGTDQIADAMVSSLDRSTAVNKKKRIRDCNEAKRGGWAKWARARKGIPRGNFPWAQLFPPPALSGTSPSDATGSHGRN